MDDKILMDGQGVDNEIAEDENINQVADEEEDNGHDGNGREEYEIIAEDAQEAVQNKDKEVMDEDVNQGVDDEIAEDENNDKVVYEDNAQDGNDREKYEIIAENDQQAVQNKDKTAMDDKILMDGQGVDNEIAEDENINQVADEEE